MTDKTVPHAIERGIYFLFANRRFCGNEPRGRQPLDCGYGQQPVRSLRAPETVQRHPSSGGRGHGRSETGPIRKYRKHHRAVASATICSSRCATASRNRRRIRSGGSGSRHSVRKWLYAAILNASASELNEATRSFNHAIKVGSSSAWKSWKPQYSRIWAR